MDGYTDMLSDAEAITGDACATPFMVFSHEPEPDLDDQVEMLMLDMALVVSSMPAAAMAPPKPPKRKRGTKPYAPLPEDAPNPDGFPPRPIIKSQQNRSQQKVIDQLYRAVMDAYVESAAIEQLLAITVLGTNSYSIMALRYQNALLAKLGHDGEPRQLRKREDA